MVAPIRDPLGLSDIPAECPLAVASLLRNRANGRKPVSAVSEASRRHSALVIVNADRRIAFDTAG